MRLLLDTHIFLWWLADDPKLRSVARAALADPDSLIYVSAASLWEIAIKSALGKLAFEGDPLIEITGNGFQELPITGRHALAAGQLPRHHDDPFDRMLAAQSRLENLVLVSEDAALKEYGVPLFSVG